jgi:UDP-3-O-[3-hydroxymyristoyl] glucosamine N-acyltransferase
MEFSINDLALLLNGEVEGDGSEKVHRIDKIQEGKRGGIGFLSNPKYEQYIYTTEASAVLVNKDFQPKKKVNTTLLRVEDPYSSFTLLLEEYQKILNFQKTGVECPSFIGENTAVGKNVYRGAFSYIGANIKIGDNVKIYPHVYIGDDVEIGDNTIIYAGAKIYERTVIGSGCTIHAGAVLGSDGFGFAPQPDGTFKTIPQVGNVILGDNVNIGANTTIDRATFESTLIESGAKLDNLIQIGHNVKIGSNTVIAAQTGISGSTVIGKNCMIAGQVGITGHLTIADKVKIAAQTGILSNIENEGEMRLGSPSMERMKYLKSFSVFRVLPELKNSIKQLEEKVINLSARLNNDEQ